MSKQHDDVLTDEVYATLKWYLDDLPKPGESKKDDEDEGSDSGIPPEEGDFDVADDAEGAPPEGAPEAPDDEPEEPKPEAEPATEPEPEPSEPGDSDADDYIDAPPER